MTCWRSMGGERGGAKGESDTRKAKQAYTSGPGVGSLSQSHEDPTAAQAGKWELERLGQPCRDAEGQVALGLGCPCLAQMGAPMM